jgi:hypothetical protein
MPTARHAALRETIASYQSLIASYTLAYDRLVIRRRSATDSTMVELDSRMEVNRKTVEAFRRALEATREHLKMLDQGRR